jgi:hypothetical protein
LKDESCGQRTDLLVKAAQVDLYWRHALFHIGQTGADGAQMLEDQILDARRHAVSLPVNSHFTWRRL